MMTPDKAQELANDIACAITTLQAVADELTTAYPDSDYNEPEEKNLPDIAEQAETETAATGEQNVTVDQVRELLTAKAGAGFQTEVKTMLKKHGSKMLSQIPEAELPALYKEAEALK
jgi:hypothetical protein